MITAFLLEKFRKPSFERCMGFFFGLLWGPRDVSCCLSSFKICFLPQPGIPSRNWTGLFGVFFPNSATISCITFKMPSKGKP